MKFIDKKNSRIIFTQFIYSNFFVSTNIKHLIHTLEIKDYDKNFLNILIEKYKNDFKIIHNFIKPFIIDDGDLLLIAILYAGYTNFILHSEKKLIIKEYLSIADSLNSKASTVHKILDKILI